MGDNNSAANETADGEVDVPLSPRECDVLLWLAKGLRSQRIAERLGIARVTVDMHMSNARKKLKATTREHALAKAIQKGLIDP